MTIAAAQARRRRKAGEDDRGTPAILAETATILEV
jgi:hypothetical protein